MMPVSRDKRLRRGIGRKLRSGCCQQVRSNSEVAIIAEAVGLHMANGRLFKIWRKRRARLNQKLAGAPGIFNPRPDIVAAGKPEQRFGKIAVLLAVVVERACAPPDQRRRPVPCVLAFRAYIAEGPVVHHRRSLALLVFVRIEGLRADDVRNGALPAPVVRWRKRKPRRVAVDRVTVSRRLKLPALFGWL